MCKKKVNNYPSPMGYFTFAPSGKQHGNYDENTTKCGCERAISNQVKRKPCRFVHKTTSFVCDTCNDLSWYNDRVYELKFNHLPFLSFLLLRLSLSLSLCKKDRANISKTLDTQKEIQFLILSGDSPRLKLGSRWASRTSNRLDRRGPSLTFNPTFLLIIYRRLRMINSHFLQSISSVADIFRYKGFVKLLSWEMSSQESRASRGIRRRKAVIDLNEVPRDHEGTTSASVREAPTVVPSGASVPSQPVPTMIDVDAIEDDVIESSASAFAEVWSLKFLTFLQWCDGLLILVAFWW